MKRDPALFPFHRGVTLLLTSRKDRVANESFPRGPGAAGRWQDRRRAAPPSLKMGNGCFPQCFDALKELIAGLIFDQIPERFAGIE